MSPRREGTVLLTAVGVAVGVALAGCRVGPDYQRPAAPVAATFSEAPPRGAAGQDGWRTARPSDQVVQAGWWTSFGDAALDSLESQIEAGNQTLQQAEANFRSARAAVRFSRAAQLPTLGIAPYAGPERLSAHQPYFSSAAANSGLTEFSLPLDLSYEVDLWGRIRRGVTAAREQAQAAAADRETVRLALHAELAIDYFNLRSDLALEQLLHATVTAYGAALQLTQDRYDGGAAPQSDVAQARAQLETARVQETDIAVQRAAYEHAIAVLIGQPPGSVVLEAGPLLTQPPALPAVPGLLPSDLLERRPDVAGAERRMAAANEQIGIARAAYYPTLTLSGTGGFMGTSLSNWFTWPSRFWAVGPTFSQTLFDHGRLRANSEIAQANYDHTVAGYRQAVLSATQEVEDNLAALRELEVEARQQRAATAAAEQSLAIFQSRYEGGVDTYLQVVTSQTLALQNERNDIDLLRRRLEASVLLVKALGGGWNASQLPTVASLP
jgi:NodT family efflux transporter outer membrane factor (OMF) lipoprotein